MDKTILPLLLSLLTLSACIPVNALLLAKPDHKDQERFANRAIKASDQCFSFQQSIIDYGTQLKVNDWTKDIPFFVSIDKLAKSHKTRSFLVIQNDSILYEYYGEETDENSLHPSYSIAKSFTSALVGIAIDEGHLPSEKTRVLQYIPELKGKPNAKYLTIEHLLNHTSGIQYGLATDATIYYGKDILKGIDKIKFAYKPGTRQHYVNVNVQLLGLVLFRATGIPPASYLQEKIWQPAQMCTDAFWSIDQQNELEKTYCCLAATAQDYAKFGRLYLNKGNWNGQQLISEEWINKSIRRDTTEGSSFNYNYCWHIGLEQYGDFMAIGLYKQHIYINPKKNLLIVLLNNKEDKLAAERVIWWDVFRQIADQL